MINTDQYCFYRYRSRHRKRKSNGWFRLARNFSVRTHVKFTRVNEIETLESLSSDVFEWRTSTGSEVFSLLTCLDDIKFVFFSFFTVIEAIWLKICAKTPSKNEKRPLPVDVRRSKTLLLKLPNVWKTTRKTWKLSEVRLLLLRLTFHALSILFTRV